MHLQGVADPANHVAAPRRQPRVQVERRAPAQPKVRAHDLPAPGGQFVPRGAPCHTEDVRCTTARFLSLVAW